MGKYRTQAEAAAQIDFSGITVQAMVNTARASIVEAVITAKTRDKEYKVKASGGKFMLVDYTDTLTPTKGYVRCRPYGANPDGSEDKYVRHFLTQDTLLLFGDNKEYTWTTDSNVELDELQALIVPLAG